MASLIHHRARQYRARAEEARLKAEGAQDEGRRAELLQIAETWERMADWEEKNPVFEGRFSPLPENWHEHDLPSD